MWEAGLVSASASTGEHRGIVCRCGFASGAAQESNLPSDGLRRLTGFEDRLGHRAHAAPGAA